MKVTPEKEGVGYIKGWRTRRGNTKKLSMKLCSERHCIAHSTCKQPNSNNIWPYHLSMTNVMQRKRQKRREHINIIDVTVNFVKIIRFHIYNSETEYETKLNTYMFYTRVIVINFMYSSIDIYINLQGKHFDLYAYQKFKLHEVYNLKNIITSTKYLNHINIDINSVHSPQLSSIFMTI